MSLQHRTCWLLLVVPILLLGAKPSAAEVPPWTPRYDLDIHLDVARHQALVRERVTWINYHKLPARELVFNAHSHYKLPDKDVGFLAKMLEILRLNPSEALDFDGHSCDVQKVTLLGMAGPAPTWTPAPALGQPTPQAQGETLLHAPRPVNPQGVPAGPPIVVPPVGPPVNLAFQYQNPRRINTTIEPIKDPKSPDLTDPGNDTALVVSLPRPVGQWEAVTVEVEFIMHLPQKQGRWGHWEGVTFLSNWHPVLAFYDDCGWQPTPFVVWHQPFFNEAGIYTAHVTLPCDQKFAHTGSVMEVRKLDNGLQEVRIDAGCVREFAFLCSARFCEYTQQAGPVKVHCFAFPEHEHYAREMLRIACEAIPVYSKWFGPYPYPDFSIVESYFGWNGNECSGLVMIDERIFALPHVACGFVDGLVSHETCHQWWYNVVGTNGYCETWMDEGLATYFSYRIMEAKHGKNDKLLTFPAGLNWLPNISRNTYRFYSLYGTIGRGECTPTVQELPKFGHLVDLLSMTYDRGGKIVGMIEDRMGPTAFLDFMHVVYARYQFRILRVADFQHELEAYTGRSWEEFFKHWLYQGDMTDWAVEKVKVEPTAAPAPADGTPVKPSYHVTVLLHQKAEYCEQTVLGVRFDKSDDYQVRIPIVPEEPVTELTDPPTRIENLPGNRVRVEMDLPCEPTQIAVDPDQVLVDRNPANNFWKPAIRWQFTPIYTQLEETDLTTDYDRWNVIAGPWVYGSTWEDPWYSRSNMAGVRAGLYRTQEFSGGVYLAYRTDYRDIAAGADALWDHWPFAHTQVGLNVERTLTNNFQDRPSGRGVLYGRYIFQYGDSLYLPPMTYLETFSAILENPLPQPREQVPGADHVDHATAFGLHYHMDYLTPYWDPEGGFRLDATFTSGVGILGEESDFQRVNGQFSMVKCLPDWTGDWLSQTRLAGRIYGAAGVPLRGEFFTLGGAELFRGFDMQQRQGSMMWLTSAEWRVPVVKGLTLDCCDHMGGLRNIYAAAFYDVGEIYVKGHTLGGLAQAAGGGLRFDMAWFSLIERTIVRVDVAQAFGTRTAPGGHTPTQLWFGIQQPF